MATEAEDKIRRAFVRISSIRKNLPDTYHIDEPLVREYSEALRHLEELGFDVAEFQIPRQWLEHPVVMSSPQRGVQYAKERSVKRSLFVTKLDAILLYFTSEKEKIGFSGSKAG